MISRIGLVAVVVSGSLCANRPTALAVEATAKQDPPARPKKLQLLTRPRTPPLVGPDELEPAPVFALTKQRAELDGRPMTPDELEKTLGILANNWRILNPTGTFGGKFIVACEPEVDTRRLAEYLARAHKAGYPNASFLFIKLATAVGATPSDDIITTANAELVVVPGTTARPKSVSLKVDKYADCASLSKELIAQRQQRPVVLLDIGRPPLKPGKRGSKP